PFALAVTAPTPSLPECGSVRLPASVAVRLATFQTLTWPLALATASVPEPPKDMPQIAGLPWRALGIAAACFPLTLQSTALPLMLPAASTLPSPLNASPLTASQMLLTEHEPPGTENVAVTVPEAMSHRYTWPA